MNEPRPKWWQSGMRYRANGSIEWRFYVQTLGGAKQVSAYGRTWPELKADRALKERRFETAPENIKLNELLDRFIEHKRTEKKADPRNLAMLSQKFADYVRPKLGRYDLADLCTQWSIIGNVFAGYKKTHPNSRTIQITFDELRRAFRYALSKQWCTINPLVNLERPQYTTGEHHVFDAAQIYELLDLAKGQNRMMIFLFICTTLRPGELYGLRVRNCDFLHKLLHVMTFVNTDEKGKRREKASGKGKSQRAIREIPLIAPVSQALERYIHERGLAPDDYLFPDAQGKLLIDTNWRRTHFKPLVEAIGLPNARIYDLRHSANSFLAELGVDAETRAAICGHSEEVNKRIYTHFSLEAKRKAMNKLEALFTGYMEQTFEGENKGTKSA